MVNMVELVKVFDDNSGLIVIGPKNTKFPAEGHITHIGEISNFNIFKFTPDQSKMWIHMCEDLHRLHHGCSEIFKICNLTIIVMSECALIEVFYAKWELFIRGESKGVARKWPLIFPELIKWDQSSECLTYKHSPVISEDTENEVLNYFNITKIEENKQETLQTELNNKIHEYMILTHIGVSPENEGIIIIGPPSTKYPVEGELISIGTVSSNKMYRFSPGKTGIWINVIEKYFKSYKGCTIICSSENTHVVAMSKYAMIEHSSNFWGFYIEGISQGYGSHWAAIFPSLIRWTEKIQSSDYQIPTIPNTKAIEIMDEIDCLYSSKDSEQSEIDCDSTENELIKKYIEHPLV